MSFGSPGDSFGSPGDSVGSFSEIEARPPQTPRMAESSGLSALCAGPTKAGLVGLLADLIHVLNPVRLAYFRLANMEIELPGYPYHSTGESDGSPTEYRET